MNVGRRGDGDRVISAFRVIGAFSQLGGEQGKRLSSAEH